MRPMSQIIIILRCSNWQRDRHRRRLLTMSQAQAKVVFVKLPSMPAAIMESPRIDRVSVMQYQEKRTSKYLLDLMNNRIAKYLYTLKKDPH